MADHNNNDNGPGAAAAPVVKKRRWPRRVLITLAVLVALLVWIGIVDVKYLRKIRPYVIIGCFVVGMILTPPDIFSYSMPSETLTPNPTETRSTGNGSYNLSPLPEGVY